MSIFGQKEHLEYEVMSIVVVAMEFKRICVKYLLNTLMYIPMLDNSVNRFSDLHPKLI